jgi:hypothetical protein
MEGQPQLNFTAALENIGLGTRVAILITMELTMMLMELKLILQK